MSHFYQYCNSKPKCDWGQLWQSRFKKLLLWHFGCCPAGRQTFSSLSGELLLVTFQHCHMFIIFNFCKDSPHHCVWLGTSTHLEISASLLTYTVCNIFIRSYGCYVLWFAMLPLKSFYYYLLNEDKNTLLIICSL